MSAVTVIHLAADEEMFLPELKLVVHASLVELNDWRREQEMDSTGFEDDDPDADSHGITTLDTDRVPQFEMHLAADSIHLSVVAHECTHVALWHYDQTVSGGAPGARASAHIGNHDETIPYTVGNLSALVWYQLLGAGFEPYDDRDPDLAAPGIP